MCMKYRFELVGGYKNGMLSAPDSCTVEIDAPSMNAAQTAIVNAIQTVDRFSGMRIYDVYEKTPEVCALDSVLDVYDVTGNIINKEGWRIREEWRK